ncbi:GerAB/ArcD/ProY family transporter [Cohnella rhizosphaerae]|uniref:GerAB/ArcD/ProY family transporter n=1 Tax=Cohnella rhizosphaerae TaxID=1457232 RepID=UPI003B8A7B67
MPACSTSTPFLSVTSFAFFLFPFSDAKTKLFKGVLAGHAIITSTYLLTIAISFGFFSFEEVKILQFPVIHTLEYIEIPFINRVENLVFPFFFVFQSRYDRLVRVRRPQRHRSYAASRRS